MSDLILYTTEDGRSEIKLRAELCADSDVKYSLTVQEMFV